MKCTKWCNLGVGARKDKSGNFAHILKTAGLVIIWLIGSCIFKYGVNFQKQGYYHISVYNVEVCPTEVKYSLLDNRWFKGKCVSFHSDPEDTQLISGVNEYC